MLTSKLGNTFSKFGKETEKHIDNALTWLLLGDNLTNVCPVSYLLLNIHIYIASNVNHYKVDHDSVFSATTIPPFLPIPKSLALEGYLLLIILSTEQFLRKSVRASMDNAIVFKILQVIFLAKKQAICQ